MHMEEKKVKLHILETMYTKIEITYWTVKIFNSTGHIFNSIIIYTLAHY